MRIAHNTGNRPDPFYPITFLFPDEAAEGSSAPSTSPTSRPPPIRTRAPRAPRDPFDLLNDDLVEDSDDWLASDDDFILSPDSDNDPDNDPVYGDDDRGGFSYGAAPSSVPANSASDGDTWFNNFTDRFFSPPTESSSFARARGGIEDDTDDVPSTSLVRLSRDETELVLPLAPLGSQVSYYTKDAAGNVQRTGAGLLGAVVFSKFALLAAGSATLPLWAPWLLAAARNASVVRMYTFDDPTIFAWFHARNYA